MSENEKRLRALITELAASGPAGRGGAAAMRSALDALLAEHEREVSAARDAALEEAARQYEAWAAENCQTESPTPEKRIRALKASPATVLPAERVREVLAKAHATNPPARPVLEAVGVTLGLPLDAEGEGERAPPAPMCWKDCGSEHLASEPCPRACRVCEAKPGEPHKLSCRSTEREAAGRPAERRCQQCHGVPAYADGFCSDDCQKRFNEEVAP